MTDRYFVTSPIHGDRAALVDAEAHHLVHVMRVNPGDCVTLFDGSGEEFPARIERVGRDRVDLAVLGRESPSRELSVAVTLGVAMPKGERKRWLVEKAVELGVARIVPLLAARSPAKPEPQSLDRLRRTVVEAAKQCGRNRLLQIGPPQTWTEFLANSEGVGCRLLAHPGGTTLSAGAVAPAAGDRSAGVWLAIGPEGGLSQEEVSAAVDAGWRLVDLGPRILRIETAATLLVALVLCGLAGR